MNKPMQFTVSFKAVKIDNFITGDRCQTKQFCFLDADCLVVGERQGSSLWSAGKYPVKPWQLGS